MAKLITPTPALREAYISFYNEWKASGDEMIPWVIQRDPSDFEAMLQWLQDNREGRNLPDGWVPDSTYWLVYENRVLGVVNIRHALTERLRNAGGHIGYGIRPTERGKGYATKLLALSLEKMKELGIRRVLVVCDETNPASERVILHNGGVRDEDYVEEDGNVIRRFWIEV